MLLDQHRDAKRRGDEFLDEIKLSLLSSRPESLKDLWPELIPTTKIEDEGVAVETLEDEEGEIEWEFDQPLDPSEVEKMFSHALADSSGDLGEEVPDDDDQGGEWI